MLHPWILTGTPIVNSLADLGPGLDFVGKENLKDFQKRIASIEKKVGCNIYGTADASSAPG